MKLRRLVVFAHDLIAAALAWMAAFWLRFNFDPPDEFVDLMLAALPWVLLTHAAVFLARAVSAAGNPLNDSGSFTC